jgi:hypothetical protein
VKDLLSEISYEKFQLCFYNDILKEYPQALLDKDTIEIAYKNISANIKSGNGIIPPQ